MQSRGAALLRRPGLSLHRRPPAPERRSCACARPAAAGARRLRTQAAFNPPPLAETKLSFLSHYRKVIPGIYAGVIQEILAQQHFMRYAANYEYNQIYALGVYSVFEQILESLDERQRSEIFNAYIRAFREDPELYRRDALLLEREASALTAPDLLRPGGDLEVQKALSKMAEKAAVGKLAYNRFFAIGLFRLLELTGAKEPSSLEALVKGVGVKPEVVSRDLIMYKGVLSKLNIAKELMRDFMDREKRRQAEREAAREVAPTAAPAVAADMA